MHIYGKTTLAGVLAAATLGAALPAQAMSSQGYFVSAVDLAGGGVSSSTSYGLVAALGNGVALQPSGSANYKITGGYTATLEVATTGQPWITAVTPRYAPPLSATLLTLRGIDLDLGPLPTVSVGGVTAQLVTRTSHVITARMPFRPGPVSGPAPGWQPVEVSNNVGSTRLTAGTGVLPLLAADPAPAPNTRFDLVFKGSQGDQVFWVLSAAPTPPIQLADFLYGLGVHPLAMVVMPPLTIAAADGELRFAVPATAYAASIYVQALFATSNPGYAPASFSNVLRL